MSREEAETVLRSAGAAPDSDFPLLEAAIACAIHEDPSRDPQAARDLGSKLRSPFMTLSFMALLVIPELKLSDRGLFAGARGKKVPVIS